MNINSSAFDAYIEKRKLEKVAGVMQYATNVAAVAAASLNGDTEVTKEAAEAVRDSHLFPVTLDVMMKIAAAKRRMATQGEVDAAEEFGAFLASKGKGAKYTQKDLAEYLDAKSQFEKSKGLRGVAGRAGEKIKEVATKGKTWISKNPGKAALGAAGLAAAGYGAKKIYDKSKED